jgi:hypothetical protein
VQTFADVKAFVAEQTSQDETDTILSARLLPRWVGRGLERIQRFTYWRFTGTRGTFTWPTGGVLYLPHNVFRLDQVFPANNVGYPVAIMPYWELDRLRPGSAVAWGRQDRLVMHGLYNVAADVTSDGVITATHDGTGALAQSVRIWGLDVNNFDINETLSVPDGGPASTTASFKSGPGGVQGVELLGTSSGAVITFTDAAGETLERLDSVSERRHDHWRTEMHAQSGGTGTYDVRYWRRLIVPENITDTWGVPLPTEYHDLLETWVESELERWRKDPQSAALLRSQFKQDLIEAIAHDRRDPSRRTRFRVNRGWGGIRR